MATWSDCQAYLEAHCKPSDVDTLDAPTLLYAQVLWVLAECLAVQSVLEIGIGPRSVSGCTWIHSMSNRGGGKLYSVDIATDRPLPEYRDLAAEHGVSWTTVYGDSLHVQLAKDLQVDLLYIDGNHLYEYALGDTLRYLPHLRTGGYLVIDDYPAFPGVLQAGQELYRMGMQFVHLAHHPPHGNGRLLWQKP